MSHEIRTPLNGVVGMSELLMDTKLDTKQLHFAETLNRSAMSLLTVINDVLDFSKIAAGRLELEHVDFDLNEEINDVLNMLAVRTHAKGLELACLVERDVNPWCIGDSLRIRQILTNLIGNAVKFTNVGEIVVKVAVLAKTDSHQTLKFEVSDTGIGIDANMHRKIFESFAQADGSTTRRYGGTGLGLAIAKQLIEKMRGNIAVRSTFGNGATFTFDMTLETGAPKDTAVQPRNNLEGLRALVVDDNATNREILHYQLTGWNVAVDCVASGDEALKRLSEKDSSGRYDFAILDMHMPVMDGVELAERISRIESLKNLPLVMLSSAGLDMPEHTQTKMFIRAWLTKPVNQSRLYDCLLRVTAQHKCGEVADIPAQSVKASVANLANLRVLLVEDNPINQDVAGHMLTNLGCQYEVVDDGRQAVAKYQSKAFDLILMDCYMPVMDGHTATGAIRELESKNNSRRIPIIALTANAMAGDREKCLAAGMDDHLAKPFKREALTILVQKWTLGEQPTDYMDAISPETNVDAKQLLDFEIFDSLRELDAASANSGFLKKLLKTYLDIAPRNIEQIREAISKGDADALKSAVHSLKRSSANLGALEFAELCQSLETKGRQNSLADSPLIFSQLTQHYEELRSNLVAELRTIKQ